MTDLLVVGAGLTGLFAAALAAERGANVTIVARGRGGLGLSHGCLDIWTHGPPLEGIGQLARPHPYPLAGVDALRGAVETFERITQRAGYPFVGSLSENLALPTAAGTIHRTAYAPQSLAQGSLANAAPFVVGGIEGFRDFYAEFAASNLKRAGFPVAGVITLPLAGGPVHRDAYATDLARLFDDPARRETIARAWGPKLGGVRRLGLPAVVGLDAPPAALREMEGRLGIALFEIPTLPPCVPGLRLERVLRRAAIEAGVHVVEGPGASGAIDRRGDGRRVTGVVAETSGGPRLYRADAVVLATGDVLHGGLVARQDGSVEEPVFGLPVWHMVGRDRRTGASPLARQLYAVSGVNVDRWMRPLGPDGTVAFDNLYAAGGLLAGADRAYEGSRQGIGLATAFRAVESALGHRRSA